MRTKFPHILCCSCTASDRLPCLHCNTIHKSVNLARIGPGKRARGDKRYPCKIHRRTCSWRLARLAGSHEEGSFYIQPRQQQVLNNSSWYLVWLMVLEPSSSMNNVKKLYSGVPWNPGDWSEPCHDRKHCFVPVQISSEHASAAP